MLPRRQNMHSSRSMRVVEYNLAATFLSAGLRLAYRRCMVLCTAREVRVLRGRAMLLAFVLCVPAIASAQIEIVERPSPSPTPAAGDADAANDSVSSAVPVVSPRRYDDTWPVSVGRLRGLPECEPGTVLPLRGTGENYTCHPAFPPNPGPMHLQFTMGAALGAGRLGSSNPQRAVGIDLGLGNFFTRGFGISFDYRMLATARRARDVNGDSIVDESLFGRTTVHSIGGTLRLRWLTDEPSHRAWLFGLGAGYARAPRQGPSGAIAHVEVQRQVGFRSGPTGSVHFQLGARFDQGLSADNRDYRALVLTGGFGVSGGERAPRGFESLRSNPRVPVAISPSLNFAWPARSTPAGPVFGIGLALGLPQLHGVLEPRIVLGFDRFAANVDAPEGSRASKTRRFSLGGGLRVRPLPYAFFEVLAGYRAVVGDEPNLDRSAPYVEGSVGSGGLWCGFALSPALFYRWSAAERSNPSARSVIHEVGLRIEVSIGTSSQTFRAERCGGARPGHNPASRQVPPARTVPSEPPRADVRVEIEPVEVSVVIGYSLFGGAVQMQIDVSRLPLDQLRSAGRIEVQIIGPPAAAAQAQAQLRASLDSQGIRVSGFANASSDAAEIRAVFRIYPPGS